MTWRWLAKVLLAALRLRRYTPAPWERGPSWEDGTWQGEGDTGGGGWYRPPHRRQDPSSDPQEPGGGESSGAGNDHGWSNCTMAAGAMALAFHTLGKDDKWGGHLRHHQGDQSGGTDLYDLREAWDAYGEDLTIRSGAGWAGLQADRDAGRFLVVQGTGNVPGSATFDGGHACALGPETDGDGRWLWGDPLASGWQWVTPSSIRTWMEAWSSSLSYARSAAHPPATDPEPPDPPPPPDTTPYDARDLDHARQDGYQAGQLHGRQVGEAHALDAAFLTWSPGRPRTPLEAWDATTWDAGAWGGVPWPLAALAGARLPATWGHPATTWTGAVWRDVTVEDAGTWGEAAWSAPWA